MCRPEALEQRRQEDPEFKDTSREHSKFKEGLLNGQIRKNRVAGGAGGSGEIVENYP